MKNKHVQCDRISLKMKATLSYDNSSNHTPVDTKSHPRRLERFMEGVHDHLLEIRSTMFHGEGFIICKLKIWLTPTHLWAGKLSRYSDWLRAGWSGDRILVRSRFYSPVQTGPGAHPASCTMGTGSFPGVESGQGVTLTPHPHLVLRSTNRVGLYLCFP
jgi:hypothetical protein